MSQTESNETKLIVAALNEKIETLSACLGSPPDSIELYFICSTPKSTPKYRIYQSNLNADVNDVFVKILNNSLREYISAFEKNQLNFLEYNTLNQEDSERDTEFIQYLIAERGDTYPNIPNIECFLPLVDRLSLPQNSNLPKFWAYVIRVPIGDRDDAFYLFNKASEGNILGKKEHLLHLLDGKYNTITGKALSLSKSADCLLIADTMFIFDTRKFENIFRYSEQYVKNISNMMPELKQWDYVDNADDLLKYCISDLRKLRRLDRVLTRGKYVSLSNKMIRQMVEDFNLNIKFSEEKIKVTPRNILEVLTVLEDYCVETYGNKEKMLMRNGVAVTKGT